MSAPHFSRGYSATDNIPEIQDYGEVYFIAGSNRHYRLNKESIVWSIKYTLEGHTPIGGDPYIMCHNDQGMFVGINPQEFTDADKVTQTILEQGLNKLTKGELTRRLSDHC
jgi:hypothetical protein